MKDPNKKVESARITKTLSDPIGFPTRWERSFIRLGKDSHPFGKIVSPRWESFFYRLILRAHAYPQTIVRDKLLALCAYVTSIMPIGQLC